MTSQTNQSTPLVVASTLKPRRKVLASGFTGALVTLAVIILNTYVISDKDKQISAELSAATTVVLSSLVAYLLPPDPDETTINEDGVTKAARQPS